MSNCKFCGKEIVWIKEGRRSKAIDIDGGVHSCEEMKSSLKSFKKIDRSEVDADLIAQYEKAINEKKK